MRDASFVRSRLWTRGFCGGPPQQAFLALLENLYLKQMWTADNDYLPDFLKALRPSGPRLPPMLVLILLLGLITI